ncbi:hypothetical protein EX30DRAFT_339366 [Ascodesmis nigricans]|uniref:Granulins domain-containing protein n=1 Tax=Ascodesmis nigricans TaxID=341454 RepID=A0A4S2N227_9PEZI|nr:hypothetical protein EX30DRAFT_339366 [Ascodesmis nigricans]
MKPTTSFTILSFLLLPFTTLASPDHTAAMRIFTRSTSIAKRDLHSISQGLYKRQLDVCVDAGYELCPSETFCCPAGLTCVEGGWCGNESETTCYAGEDDCGSHCCLVGYKCVAGSTSCRAVDGSSKSGNDDGNDDSTGGSVGVDVSKKKGTKGGKSGTGSLLDLLDGDDNDNDNKEQEPARGAGSRMAVGGRVLEVVVVGVAILVL